MSHAQWHESVVSHCREATGVYAKNTINLTPKVVDDIHKRGGTILGTSRGGHDTSKIVDSIQDRGINQVGIGWDFLCRLKLPNKKNEFLSALLI